MTNHLPHHAGIDISKDHLDVHILPGDHAQRFSNTASGWQALAQWLTDFAPERIVYESTGPYHRGMERALASLTLPIVRLNARRVRSFADALGILAKTDQIDARILARFAAVMMPDVTKLNSDAVEELKELESARRALIKSKTALTNRSKTLATALLKRQARVTCRQIDTHIAQIDQAATDIIAAHEDLKRRFEIVCSIPGIGPATALALIVLMPELGTLDEKQAASLAGLAPVACDSGTWRGQRFCQGGRAKLRQALYMPALVAARHNADLRAKYDDLIGRGKPPKVAITALMRKLIILANALVRDDRTWTSATT